MFLSPQTIQSVCAKLTIDITITGANSIPLFSRYESCIICIRGLHLIFAEGEQAYFWRGPMFFGVRGGILCFSVRGGILCFSIRGGILCFGVRDGVLYVGVKGEIL